MPSVTIQRVGHACFRFVSPKGRVLVVDPWLSGNPSLAPGWDQASAWEDVDHVLVTHAHFDHTSGVKELLEAAPGAQLIAQFEVIMTFLGQGVENVLPMNIGGTVDLDGVKVSAVRAAHSSCFADAETGQLTYGGTALGFVIEFENGFKVYAAGDTGLHADMKFVVADFFKPDVALLPCDGLMTMSPEQAVYAAGVLGCRHIIPFHDFPSPERFEGMGPFIAQYPFIGMMVDHGARFAELLQATHPSINAVVLQPGGSVTF